MDEILYKNIYAGLPEEAAIDLSELAKNAISESDFFSKFKSHQTFNAFVDLQLTKSTDRTYFYKDLKKLHNDYPK